jgi:LacI family transcriptional regulator
MKKNRKKAGIQEIARLANVSIGTVDRALHGRDRISDRTREHILRIAQRLGYKPNLAARALSVGRAVLRIGVCIPREIHYYFDQLRDGILAEARRFESLGVEVLYRPTERLGVQEVERVSEAVNDEIRILIITPGDPQGLTPSINEAEKRGIRVICVDTDAPKSCRSSVVCLNVEVGGRLAAELMSKFVSPRSDVAVITGILQVEAHRKKTESFCESYHQFCQGGRVLEVAEAHDDEEEAFQKCSAMLKKYQSLAGLYVSTGNCLPVCRAIDAHGLSGQVKLITTDMFGEMIPFFENGTIFASIDGRPYLQGQIAIRMAVDHIVHGSPLPPSRYLAPQIVMRSTLRFFTEPAREQTVHESRADNLGGMKRLTRPDG